VNTELNSFKARAEAVLPFAFATGIMLSSDMLVILGNFFGHTGFAGFFPIGLSAVIYSILLSQYRDLLDQSPESTSDVDLLEEYAGPILTLFQMFVKLIAVLFLATGLLVSSGFVFNEIFVYWFPNFGFAFLLLFFLIILQLLPNRMVLNFQLGFIGISVLGLLVLIIAGLFTPPDLVVVSKVDIPATMSTGIHIWFIPLLFFIGFDMGFLIWDRSNQPVKKSYSQITFALSFMVLLFILWGMVTIKHVPLQKLSTSTIPHIITARYIGGYSFYGCSHIFSYQL
jgi:amino acid transporter